MVYCGGLENRFGLTPDGGSNPSLSARKTVNELTKILIWAAVIGALFAYLWWQGQVRRFAVYIQETREELKKCSWPTWQELKGSTVVIAVSIALFGVFVVVADQSLRLVIYEFFLKL